MVLSLFLALAPVAGVSLPQQDAPPQRFEEHLVVGGPGDFMQVRRLVLRGTQAEIGRQLAEVAQERHDAVATPSGDPLRTRAQRSYFRRNAPAFLERMSGAAAAFGLELEDDDWNFGSLSYGFGRPGCSVVYFPPSTTEWGTGVVSRNFDFTTGTFAGRTPDAGKGEESIVSSPYVVETYPDQGYASLSICAYDLLGGVVDGINSEGLTVALLADDEVMANYDLDPASGPQAGFGVIQIGRHLLETCADVEQAMEALLEAKLYYTSIPCHYLIADRHGRSFVWENSRSLTQGYIIEGGDEPLATTNFMHHLHLGEELPEDGRLGSFSRYEAIRERWQALAQPVDFEFVRATSACVAATYPAPAAPFAPGRTLWHALYFPEEGRLEVDFYLGEGPDGTIRRSDYFTFELSRAPARVVRAR